MSVECVLWTGFVASNGYGRRWSTLHKKMSSAHRVAWENVNGPIPPGGVIMHTCDERLCVNPGHLLCATQAANIQDMVSKERRRFDREHNPHRKLTEHQVEAIQADDRSYRTIGAEYGVHHSTIYSIKKGRSWAAASK